MTVFRGVKILKIKLEALIEIIRLELHYLTAVSNSTAPVEDVYFLLLAKVSTGSLHPQEGSTQPPRVDWRASVNHRRRKPLLRDRSLFRFGLRKMGNLIGACGNTCPGSGDLPQNPRYGEPLPQQNWDGGCRCPNKPSFGVMLCPACRKLTASGLFP